MVEIYYNENVASASRGIEADEPNKTETFENLKDLASWMLDKGLYGDFVDEDTDEIIPIKCTIENLIDAANDADVTGGYPIIFSIDVDDKVYETDWVEDGVFEDDEDVNDDSDDDFDDEYDEDDEF